MYISACLERLSWVVVEFSISHDWSAFYFPLFLIRINCLCHKMPSHEEVRVRSRRKMTPESNCMYTKRENQQKYYQNKFNKKKNQKPKKQKQRRNGGEKYCLALLNFKLHALFLRLIDFLMIASETWSAIFQIWSAVSNLSSLIVRMLYRVFFSLLTLLVLNSRPAPCANE